MSTIEIQVLIESLRTLEELIEEANNEANILRDAIKAEMLKRNTEELTAGRYIVRWSSVLSQRFDSTASGSGTPRRSTRPTAMTSFWSSVFFNTVVPPPHSVTLASSKPSRDILC